MERAADGSDIRAAHRDSRKEAFLSPRLVALFQQLSLAASLTVLVIGGVVLLGGWALSIPGLQNLAPGLPKMMPNTAMGLLLCGASLLVASSGRRRPWRVGTAALLAVAVGALGLVTIAEYLLGADLRIDKLLVQDVSSGATYPGRPSPQTSLAFVFAGGSLLASLGGEHAWRLWVAQTLGLAVGSIALMATLGYVYSSLPFYGITTYTGMALHTALAFLFLSFGIVFSRADRGLPALFTSDTAGGLLARRLLPAVVAIPLVLGGLRVWGESSGLYSTAFGLALEAALYIVGLALPLGVFASVLSRVDSQRQAAARELKAHSVQLEAANEELRSFSYSVAHDLRAPLRSTVGFSQVLMEDYGKKLDEPGRQYLTWIQESGQLMSQLIDDMLQLSRVTTAEMHQTRIDLTELAKTILEKLGKAEPGRRVECVVAPGLACSGDVRLMSHVLENLLANAWKFTRKLDTARIEVGSATQNGDVVYFVRDNGAGFDMSYVDKLFKPFQRLHKVDEFPGTGIGLAIVQRIVQRHAGRVWAESGVNKGATFYFTLP